MDLKLYNFQTRQIEEFEPITPGHVGMYVCGPTVYGNPHLGHAKVYITFDVLRRYLEHSGLSVRYVQNITDVGHLVGDGDTGDDKISAQAKLEQLEPMEVVENYTRSYFAAMDRLNVRRPSISPRASGHIPEQIEMTQTLVEKGLAYPSGSGNVYFEVAKWSSYGALSRRKIDELSGERLEESSEKKDQQDFALWRSTTPQQIMKWNSPWGEGIPGWHAECAVMARKYLGLPFDIHGGGLENIFPHNEGEQALAAATYGTEYTRFWVLNNMVTVNGQKMGKSLGNAINLEQLFTGDHELLSKQYTPAQVRLFVLSSHYRQVTDFGDEALSASAKGFTRLAAVYKSLTDQSGPGEPGEDIRGVADEAAGKIETALNNDLNTPQAIAALFDLAKEIHTREPLSPADASHLARVYDTYAHNVLGIDLTSGKTDIGNDTALEQAMDLLIELRESARTAKDFGTADAIRDRLAAVGIVLEDGAGETRWRKN